MIIKFEDNEYDFDFEEVDLKQATVIFKKYKLTPLALQSAMTNGEPDALRAIYWLMMAQNGHALNIDNLNFKIFKFGKAVEAALLQEARAEIEAKRDELEAKRNAGEDLTDEELDFLAAVAKAGFAPVPKDKEAVANSPA